MKENTKVEIFASKNAPDGKMCGFWANMNDGLIYMFNGTGWVKAVNVDDEISDLRNEIDAAKLDVPGLLGGDERKHIYSGASDLPVTISYLVMTGSLSNVILNDAALPSIVLDNVNMAGARLKRANLVSASFVNAVASLVDFTDADLTGVSFASADLTGAIFNGNTIDGADFTGATGFIGEMGGEPTIADNIIDPVVTEGDSVTWIDGIEYTYTSGEWLPPVEE